MNYATATFDFKSSSAKKLYGPDDETVVGY